MTTVNKINYLTRNNTCCHCVTTVSTAKYPKKLNKDKNRPKKGLFSRISGIKECHKWKKNNYEIYLLQLEANKLVLDFTIVITSRCSRTNSK